MAMHDRKPRRPKPPLSPVKLQELAIFYVGRFATSRSKLAQYLTRKVRERGWDGTEPPDIGALVERLADLGYVDDRSYALGKQRSLAARGYGERRLGQALSGAGIAEDDSVEALRYAARRHIGPYALAKLDRPGREKALAAMIRAGHPFSLARIIVDLAPGERLDPDQLVNYR